MGQSGGKGEVCPTVLQVCARASGRRDSPSNFSVSRSELAESVRMTQFGWTQRFWWHSLVEHRQSWRSRSGLTDP